MPRTFTKDKYSRKEWVEMCWYDRLYGYSLRRYFRTKGRATHSRACTLLDRAAEEYDRLSSYRYAPTNPKTYQTSAS